MNVISFKTRTDARNYAKSTGGKFADLGKGVDNRWTVTTDVAPGSIEILPAQAADTISPHGYKNKREHTIAVMRDLYSRGLRDRCDSMSRLMTEVGLSKKGASTYHQSVKTLLLKEEELARPTVPVVEYYI